MTILPQISPGLAPKPGSEPPSVSRFPVLAADNVILEKVLQKTPAKALEPSNDSITDEPETTSDPDEETP
jgi:hypothetical protein